MLYRKTSSYKLLLHIFFIASILLLIGTVKLFMLPVKQQYAAGSHFIAGQVFDDTKDADTDSSLDNNDVPYSSGTVQAIGPNPQKNVFQATVYNASRGAYQINNLAAGEYTVTWLDPPAGYLAPSFVVQVGSPCSVGGNPDANCTSTDDVNDLDIGFSPAPACNPTTQCVSVTPAPGYLCSPDTSPYNATPNTCSCNGWLACGPKKTKPLTLLIPCTINLCSPGDVCSAGTCVVPTNTPTITPAPTSSLPTATFTPTGSLPTATLTPSAPSLLCPSGWYFVRQNLD